MSSRKKRVAETEADAVAVEALEAPLSPQEEAHPLEDQVVRGSGPAYWLVQGGKRRLIPDMATFYGLGLRPVLPMSDELLAAIPPGEPLGGEMGHV